ncbi:MAG: DUF2273 domain-containing protein [Coriobacteriales bacterium]|nr:DUF2273 domain-containing protein [Coriobacteriales bacterium]
MAEIKAPKPRVEVVVEEPNTEDLPLGDEAVEVGEPTQEMEVVPVPEATEVSEDSADVALDEQGEADEADETQEAEEAEEDAEPEETSPRVAVLVEEPEDQVQAAEDALSEAEAPKKSEKPTDCSQPVVLNPWLSSQFPGREHAVIGGVCGLLFAIAVLYVGVYRTVFVCACMAVGSIIGLWLDGDERLVKAVQALRGKNK